MIVFTLLDLLQWFLISLNMLYTVEFLADAIIVLSKSISIALSSVSREAPIPTGMVRIRWICVCT